MFAHPDISPEVVAITGTVVTMAAVVDFREHRIPNYITVPAAVAGLAYSILPGWIGPVSALLGLVVGFGLLLLPWILGGGGMGDVKLLAALGAWLGPVYILMAFAGATLAASFMAVGILLYHMLGEGFASTKQRYLATAGGEHIATAGGQEVSSGGPVMKKPKRVLPFAVPIAVSTWFLLLWLLARQQGA